MAYLLPSTSSFSSRGARQHDVFLSFRGPDTRNNFTGHLYQALQQRGIHTFIDKELPRGEEISTSLKKAIRESKISIIIFSKIYASSSCCLDELVEIFKCQESLGQLVLPVFLYVDPSDVRNHKGSFGEALTQYEESPKKEKLPEWKIALYRAAKLSGWHLKINEDESQLIQRIVEAALSKLNRIHLHVAKHPVGIESYLQKLRPLVNIAKRDVRFIGVYGMGGIGKTTIAKAVYNYFADEFEGCSFLANVRETSKQHLGFAQLQETLLFDMLGDKNLKVGNIHRGINIIKERLCDKRVLLILDDVDELDQLETLAGGHEWFGLGSRIIITTRNKHLLTTHGANRLYRVRGLDHDRALELLSWNAFKRKKPLEDYLALSHRVVLYGDGLPLAFVILGSFLRGRTKEQWQSAIHNLEKKPHNKIYEILKISYDALQDNEKTLFLDIACFFVGEDKDYIIKLLGSNNFCQIIGIRVLSDMSLINVENNKLRMHNLIEEMGKEIVCRESPEAGNRSRLWSPDDIFHVFTENTGTNSIEGIMLKLPTQRTLYLNATSFEKMRRLRLLILTNVVLSTAIGYLPNELRLIDLPRYQFPTLPFNSGPKQLVIFNMQHSHIHRLDKGFEDFERLKVLNFSHSKFLNKIPDLSTVPNLELLYFDHCTSLVEIHESVGFLTKLQSLDLENCSNLSIFPRNLVSKYLENLVLRGCSRLQNFPNIVVKMEFLTRLELDGTAITELPSTIELIVRLHLLRIYRFEELIHIPSSIYKLLSLRGLIIGSCTKLSKFPKYVDKLEDNQTFLSLHQLEISDCNLSKVDFLESPFRFPVLELLNLSYNKFVTLPFFHSSTLEQLNLSNNKFLVSLPSFRNLPKLSVLNVFNCELLEKIPELPDVGQIKVYANDCRSLVKTPCKIMAKMISNDKGFLRDCGTEAILSGLEVPEWFSHKLGESRTFNEPSNIDIQGSYNFNLNFVEESITFDVPPNMLKNISAVIFCAVCESESREFELSFKLLGESDSPIGSFKRQIYSTKPGETWLIYVPNKTLVQLSLSDSTLKDVRKIRVTFLADRWKDSKKVVSSCGIHIVWDQDELIIDNKLIKVSQLCQNDHVIPHPKKRSFDDFADGDVQSQLRKR